MNFWQQTANDPELCICVDQQCWIENAIFHIEYLSGALFEVIDKLGSINVFKDRIFEI